MSRTEISREYAQENLTIAVGSAVSSTLNITRFAFGGVQLPSAIEGTLTWQYSIDEVDWTDGDAITFTAKKCLEIPETCWNFPAIRIKASTNQTAERVFKTFRKG